MKRPLKSNYKGKYVTTWIIYVGDDVIEIEIKYFSDPGEDPQQWFVANGPGINKLKGTDITRLRKDVEKILYDDKRLTWEKKLHIKWEAKLPEAGCIVADSHSVCADEVKVEMSVQKIEVAMEGNKGDGRWRTGEGQAATPTLPQTGKDRDWSGEQMFSLVDDTPANRAALEGVFDGFRRLHIKLMALLHPDKAQQTLASLPPSRLLSASEPPQVTP